MPTRPLSPRRSYRATLALLFVLSVAMSGTAWPQKRRPTRPATPLPVLFDHTFATTANGWWEGASADAVGERTPSGMRYHKLAGGGTWQAWITHYVDGHKDLDLALTLRVEPSAWTSTGAGLVFGGSNPSSATLFLIRNDGTYAIRHGQHDGMRTDVDWTSSRAINPPGTANVLLVEKRRDSTTYRINGTVVARLARNPLRGHMFGLAIVDSAHVTVERCTARQTATPIRTLAGVPATLERERLSDLVNSPAFEKGPLVSPDGQTLYFTRSIPTGRNSFDDDIWMSERQSDGTWGRATAMPPPINTPGHNFVASVLPDNNRLIVGNVYDASGRIVGGGYSLTERTIGGWSLPRPLQVRNHVNLSPWGEACLSPDGTTLIVTVARPDCYGERDMYFSRLQDDGTWSEAVNMGPVVNTVGDEASPFLAADGRTLYYASTGLPGYGSSDIYMTRRLDDTWTSWSEPYNLGPAINTTGWDAYYTVPADGAYAYFTKESPNGDGDIWRVVLPPQLRPNPVIIVSGTVTDAVTGAPMSSTIRYERLRTGEALGSAVSDPATGRYRIALQANDEFGFRAEAPGYVPVSQNISTAGLRAYADRTADLRLEPLVVGRTVRINNVFFDVGKAVLRTTSFADLNRLVQLLQAKPTMTIEVGGHTDDTGSDADNMSLSERRARAVMDYLADHGIDRSRVAAIGYGKSRPIVANASAADRQKNRRVEFTIRSL